MRKKPALAILVVIVLAFLSLLIFFKDQVNAPGHDKPKSNTSQKPTQLSQDEKNKYTISNQASLYYIVNKKRPLSSTYVPTDLVSVGYNEQMRSEAAKALNNLLKSAQQSGYNLKVISGYRSYAYQERVYNNYVKKDGQAKADTYSARPGHSEHQTGLAADLGNGSCDLAICFGDNPAGKWLASNAYKFGFIIRYPKDKENLTGYQYEPWHVRYLGTDLSSKVYQSGQTLEQFFGLPAPTSY